MHWIVDLSPAQHAVEHIGFEPEMVGHGTDEMQHHQGDEYFGHDAVGGGGLGDAQGPCNGARNGHEQQNGIEQPVGGAGDILQGDMFFFWGWWRAALKAQNQPPNNEQADHYADEGVGVETGHIGNCAIQALVPNMLHGFVKEDLEQDKHGNEPMEDNLGAGVGIWLAHGLALLWFASNICRPIACAT
jgi:hypothetical protein